MVMCMSASWNNREERAFLLSMDLSPSPASLSMPPWKKDSERESEVTFKAVLAYSDLRVKKTNNVAEKKHGLLYLSLFRGIRFGGCLVILCTVADRRSCAGTSCMVHCKENPIYVFLFWELRGLMQSQFHIHVSVSDLFTPRIGPHISLQQNRQTDPGNI